MGHGFLVHKVGDHVGVAVTDIPKGEAVYGLNMDTEERTETIATLDEVPLGHKIALVDMPKGAEVIEYGVRIGLTRQSIRQGERVHTHNLGSARW